MSRPSRRAFTLIEMLIVIAIIAILSVGITQVNIEGIGQKTYTAQRNLMTAFQEARMTALTKQTNARVIIYKGDDISKKLRLYGVIYETSNGWVALNSGGMLPEGTFFVPPEQEFDKFVSIPKSADFTSQQVFKSTFNYARTGAMPVIGIGEFPSNEPQTLHLGAGGDWYSYQFSSDGMSENPGARVMIATGKVNNKQMLQIDQVYDEVGFVVRKFGNTIAFTDYTEMEEVLIK